MHNELHNDPEFAKNCQCALVTPDTSKPLGLSARRSHTIILSMFHNNFDGTSRAVLWVALTARWSLDGSPSQGHKQYVRSHNMHEFIRITLKTSYVACQRSSRPSQGRLRWCCCHCCCCCALTCHFSHAHATVAQQQQLVTATKNCITFWGLKYAKTPRMLLGTCCDRGHLVIRNIPAFLSSASSCLGSLRGSAAAKQCAVCY
jgi:hypothetical protein